MIEPIPLHVEGRRVETAGMEREGLPGLVAAVTDTVEVDDAGMLLRHLIHRARTGEIVLRPGEELLYGYWPLTLHGEQANRLEIWELDKDGSAYQPGVDLAVSCWRQQHAICERASAEFQPPRPDQLVVLADGVFEGDPVSGVRYPSPDHMSGWWIFTARYNGDVNSLVTEHLHHLTALRPELMKYMALPPGFWFDYPSDELSFDDAVAQEPAD